MQVTLNCYNPKQLFQQRNSAQTHTYIEIHSLQPQIITLKTETLQESNNTFLLLHPSSIQHNISAKSRKILSQVYFPLY